MNRLQDSYANSHNYPANLVDSTFHPYELQAYLKEWGIHLWECPATKHKFSKTIINSTDTLRRHFRAGDPAQREDPMSRFAFLHAKNGRERLNTTSGMLRNLLSHHQVNAAVVDQLRSYGRRKYEQDFSACGFRSQARLSPKRPGFAIPELGRSGRQLELCYTLRTVEESSSAKWTVRQTSTYHTFDVVNGRAFWTIIKADPTIRNRLEEVTGGEPGTNGCAFDTVASCLDSALSSHLVMCHWANENWRAYIAELEPEVYQLTQKAITFNVTALPQKSLNQADVQSANTSGTHDTIRKGPMQRVATVITQSLSRRPTAQAQQPPTANIELEDAETDSDEEPDSFSINDMQTIQDTEEKIHSSLLIIQTNLDTLSQLRDYYRTLDQCEGWPASYGATSANDIAQFVVSLNNIEYDLRLQQARLETLVRLLADRKALLYAIIENSNAEANKSLALEAQRSQKHMETMTDWLSNLAEKTQQETVMMRIITLVTLFFLPGTFICTLMSTDIIKFEWLDTGSFQRHFSHRALNLFFEITVPLMVGTFVASFVIYSWTKRKQIKEKSKQLQERLREKV